MKEFQCIDRYFSPLAKGIEGALNLKDDAALLDLGGDQMLVITSDACIEGVHFPHNTSPDLIARRALRVNLSDLAAMGATPLGYTHTLAIPKTLQENWFEKYAEGLKEDQTIFDIHLLGGDTVVTPGPINISVTTFGRVTKGFGMKRSNAMNGDRIYITGPIGDAYLGLKILQGEFQNLPEESKNYFLKRYYLPTPRLFEADKLKSYVNAAIDISDGLLADLNHICQASSQKAFIDISKLPLSDPARLLLTSLSPDKQLDLLKEMVIAGDDYELILTISPDKCEDALFSAQTHNYQILQIGLLGFSNDTGGSEKNVVVINESGEKIKFSSEGYEHSW